MSNDKSRPIAVGSHGDLMVIKLAGRCTMTMGTCLNSLLDLCRRPEIADVYFDLSEVEYIDSTCVGLLVSLSLKKNDPAVPRVHLFRPAADVVRVLESMLVLPHLHCCDTLPVEITTWEHLPVELTDRDELAAVMIEAHENLIQADARNADEFSSVVKGLNAYRRTDRAESPGSDQGTKPA